MKNKFKFIKILSLVIFLNLFYSNCSPPSFSSIKFNAPTSNASTATSSSSSTTDSTSSNSNNNNSSNQNVPPLIVSSISQGWTELANTKLIDHCIFLNANFNCGPIVDVWGSAVADTTRNRLIIWGGGHRDYPGNEIYALNLNQQTPTMINLNNSDPYPEANSFADATTVEFYYPTGSTIPHPSARHTTDVMTFVPDVDNIYGGDLMYTATGGTWPFGYVSKKTWLLNFSNLNWSLMDPNNGYPDPNQLVTVSAAGQNGVSDYDPVTKKVYVYDGASFLSFDPKSNNYYRFFQKEDWIASGLPVGRIDPVRKKFYMIGGGKFWSIGIDPNDSTTYGKKSDITGFTGCDGLVNAPAPGFAYVKNIDKFVGYAGPQSTSNGGYANIVYILNPVSKKCESLNYSGGPAPTNNVLPEGGIFGRFRYFPDLNLFAIVFVANQNAFILKL